MKRIFNNCRVFKQIWITEHWAWVGIQARAGLTQILGPKSYILL